MEQLPLILCIDRAEACEIMEILFRRVGFRVISIQSARDALQLARHHYFAAVVTEYLLEDLPAEQFCRELKKANPRLPVIFYSAESRHEHRQKCSSAGAEAFLVKPNDLDHIEKTVLELALI
jgi:DNA-binding NtrC family response regulator